ncbi:MAG: polysaccharide biosynthesis protein PslH [Patescibacteria group bacterium]|jgi:glycosyltransferase involved in cell wall biosynthesis|nr:polysaccharide biosynthesis protein PslH [Patescibacteria group bacterium]
MKILMLTPYLPYPLHSGGQIRTYNLLKQLSSKHQVTLFALIKDDSEKQHIPELKKYCHKVNVFKRSKTPFTLKNILSTALSTYPFLVIRNFVSEVTPAIKSELENEAYDLIHAETFYMMPHLPPTSVPILMVEQTIEYLGYESYARNVNPFIKPFLNIDIKKIKKWEKYYWDFCNQLVVMSEDDKRFIAREIGSSTTIDVVENGVDTGWFAEVERKEPKNPTVLSVGTFKWLPNVEAVTFLAKNVWPLVKNAVPNAKLWIVGAYPTKDIEEYAEKDSDVTVTGNIPDIRDAFTQSHVLAAPVFSGKGTRYKILEALAAGTPVVATTTAVEGLGVSHNNEVLITNDAETMAQYIIELFKSPDMRRKMAGKGKQYVIKNFDWKLISQKLDSIYQKMGKKRYAKKS